MIEEEEEVRSENAARGGILGLIRAIHAFAARGGRRRRYPRRDSGMLRWSRMHLVTRACAVFRRDVRGVFCARCRINVFEAVRGATVVVLGGLRPRHQIPGFSR